MSSRCSIGSWPRTGGIGPPSWLSPSSRILNCGIDPRNSGTPPVRLLAAIRRSCSFRRERREVERVETAAEPRAPEPERSDTAAGGVAVREVLQLRHFPSDGGIGPENALMDKLRYIRFGSLAGSVFGICPNRMFCDRSR
uniref:Uncharacterized protein n=1 Tax=Oryza punctata TaxID=4537 RepID=A0A0E0M8K1_ORYPU